MAYETGWRTNKKSGEIAWTDDWQAGQNFQQLKGQGPVNSAFDEQFAGLTKSGSDVDDDGSWVTLNQQAGKGATADAKALAQKWASAGYDVRVQDLEGAEGTSQADIAVRKGSGTAAPEPPPKKKLSERAARAMAGVQSYEDWRSGRGTSGYGNETDLIFGTAEESKAANQAYADNYKLKLKEHLTPGGSQGYAGAGDMTGPDIKAPSDIAKKVVSTAKTKL